MLEKYKCNLCEEIFKLSEFEVENINGEINVLCPNQCLLVTLFLPDFSNDLKKID